MQSGVERQEAMAQPTHTFVTLGTDSELYAEATYEEAPHHSFSDHGGQRFPIGAGGVRRRGGAPLGSGRGGPIRRWGQHRAEPTGASICAGQIQRAPGWNYL